MVNNVVNDMVNNVVNNVVNDMVNNVVNDMVNNMVSNVVNNVVNNVVIVTCNCLFWWRYNVFIIINSFTRSVQIIFHITCII